MKGEEGRCAVEGRKFSLETENGIVECERARMRMKTVKEVITLGEL